MLYYKVVDRINSEAIIDTAKTNYSLTLSSKEAYRKFIDVVTHASSRLDVPIDFFVSLNNNLALWGNVYLDNLSKPKNGQFELISLTTNAKHSNTFISISDFVSVVEQLDNIGINLFQEGFYLWEKIYEDVRALKYTDKPSRDSSFFLFDNLESCKYYIEKHKGGGQICQVELIKTRTLFKADMKLLDEIPNHFTYRQAAKQVDKYWNGKISTKPVFEYLFQGTCKLTPI